MNYLLKLFKRVYRYGKNKGRLGAESAIGEVDYTLTDNQKKGKKFSRSFYVVKDIKAGEVITEENVRSIRPGYGLHPRYLPEILGKVVNLNIETGARFELQKISE